jgi:hypothetical protein
VEGGNSQSQVPTPQSLRIGNRLSQSLPGLPFVPPSSCSRPRFLPTLRSLPTPPFLAPRPRSLHGQWTVSPAPHPHAPLASIHSSICIPLFFPVLGFPYGSMARSHRYASMNDIAYPRQLTHVLPAATRPVAQQQRHEHQPRRAQNRTLHLPRVALARALGKQHRRACCGHREAGGGRRAPDEQCGLRHRQGLDASVTRSKSSRLSIPR